jgi:hypothetical protein
MRDDVDIVQVISWNGKACKSVEGRPAYSHHKILESRITSERSKEINRTRMLGWTVSTIPLGFDFALTSFVHSRLGRELIGRSLLIRPTTMKYICGPDHTQRMVKPCQTQWEDQRIGS